MERKMRTIKSNILAKFLALFLIVAYPLTACSDTEKGKGKGSAKATVFKILNSKILGNVAKTRTIVLLDKNNEVVHVLSREGKKIGTGTLGELIKDNEKVLSTRSLNIIETKGSHYFYYCNAGGNCIKISLPD